MSQTHQHPPEVDRGEGLSLGLLLGIVLGVVLVAALVWFVLGANLLGGGAGQPPETGPTININPPEQPDINVHPPAPPQGNQGSPPVQPPGGSGDGAAPAPPEAVPQP